MGCCIHNKNKWTIFDDRLHAATVGRHWRWALQMLHGSCVLRCACNDICGFYFFRWMNSNISHHLFIWFNWCGSGTGFSLHTSSVIQSAIKLRAAIRSFQVVLCDSRTKFCLFTADSSYQDRQSAMGSESIMDELASLIRTEIPEGRQSLQDSYTNLERVAEYCEDTYYRYGVRRRVL